MTTKNLTLSLPIKLAKPKESIVFGGLAVISLSIPFVLGHPQWLVGTIVNTCLFLAASFLPKKYLLPLIILPSLGVLSRGIIFGPMTPFLLYFLPFIWAGNFILITFFKSFHNLNGIFSVAISAVAKYLFLMVVANVYFKFSLVPAVFLQAMGISQLITALYGGLVFLILFNVWTWKNKRQM